jgi:CheY-like chemotaxis protein
MMLSLWTVLCPVRSEAQHLLPLSRCHLLRAVMDGYEATEKMRAAGYRKPIIAVTATTFSEDRIKCFNSGMDEVVCKPFTKSELQRIMRRFLHWMETLLVFFIIYHWFASK